MPIDSDPSSSSSRRPIQEEHLQLPTDVERIFDPSSNCRAISGESVEINANEFRLLKLPTFWHKQPKLWFVQLESEFLVYRIRSDEIKFNTVIRHLDEKALIAVAEFIERPPEKDKYLHLKNALINQFTDSEEKRLRQLLSSRD